MSEGEGMERGEESVLHSHLERQDYGLTGDKKSNGV